MKVLNDETLPEIFIIEPDVYKDDRGYFHETFQRERFLQYDIAAAFVQDNVSVSRKNVIRGLHYQLKRPQGKMVYVVQGEVRDFAVDIRQDSPTFGVWTQITLSSENHRMVYIPEGFAHAYCALSDIAHVIYKCTDYYSPLDEYGVVWNDSTLNITWPVKNPIVSRKDAALPSLNDIPKENLPVMKK